jgi:DNA repair protein RadC
MKKTVKTIKADLEAIKHIADVSVNYSTKVKAKDRKELEGLSEAYQLIWDRSIGLQLELKEFFYMLVLDRANKVLGIMKLGEGSASACIVDIQQMVRTALLCNAQGVIMWHNHPSGNINPSEADKVITERAKQALKLMDINLIDHFIITAEKYWYTSFKKEGLL